MKRPARKTRAARQDYDSPWKDVLVRFFEPFFLFFFPAAHAAIDWTRGVEFLDKELQKIVAAAELGRRLANVLAKVYLRDGSELWVLVHVEVQGAAQGTFEQRMYVYSFRGFNRYGRPVASFAILTDEDPNWRPSEFRYDVLGTELRLKFSSAKLLDYVRDWDKLAVDTNPFAVVVMAQLKALETKDDPAARYRWKLDLIKGLYERGLSADDVRQLFFCIDWMMLLSGEWEEHFTDDMAEFEEEQRMRYVSSIERVYIRRGLQQGRQEEAASMALRLLRIKLGTVKPRSAERIRQLPLEKAEQLIEAALQLSTPAELTAWLKQHAA